MKRRFVSIILVVAVLCGMMGVAPSASAVTSWEHFVTVLGQSCLDFLGLSFDLGEFVFPIVGECTEEDLLFAQDRYNSWLARTIRSGSTLGAKVDQFLDLHRAVIVEDHATNRRRLQDGTSGEWIVDYDGRYPYVPISSNDTVPDWALKPAPDCPSAPEFAPKTGNSWLELAPIQTRLKSGGISGNTSYNYNQLKDLLNGLRERYSGLFPPLGPFPNVPARPGHLWSEVWPLCWGGGRGLLSGSGGIFASSASTFAISPCWPGAKTLPCLCNCKGWRCKWKWGSPLYPRSPERRRGNTAYVCLFCRQAVPPA